MIKNNKIPKGYSRWGTFNEIDTENKEKLLSLIKDLDNSDDNNRKIKILFEQFLNRKSKLKEVIDNVKPFLSE